MKRSKLADSVLGMLAIASLLTFPPNNANAKASLSLSVGEGVYFIDGDTYRGPVSLELVPTLGWELIQFDLGLYATLESLKSADRNFIFRPGIRLTPPVIPLYLRVALPIQATHGSDWGLMFGLGVDLPVIPPFGIIVEADTFLTKERDWGGDGVPLEFRVGGRLSF
jgi:hypothetical protein